MSDYPASLDVRPLTTWPGELTAARKRERSAFSATLGTTLGELDRELRFLAARYPVLEVAIPPDQFRIDGRPRAQAKAEHPGVVLSLPKTNVGPLRYATDRFDRWQDNLRAIALGLQALRRVERYGITRRGEQYVGFRAIEANGSSMSEAEALAFLRSLAGVRHPNESAERLHRWARIAAHPDRHGGDQEQWDRVEEAAKVLGVLR